MSSAISALNGLLHSQIQTNREKSLGASLKPFSEVTDFEPASFLSSILKDKDKEEGAVTSAPQGDSIQINGVNLSYLRVSVQLHLERGVQNQAGNALGQKPQDILININYERLDINLSNVEGTDTPEETKGQDETKVNPFLQKLMEYFSPERTAERIANFVKNGFGRTSFGSEGAEDSRQRFIDFIMPYIRQGVDGALALFGDGLPDEIRGNAEKTYQLVEESLKNFATGEE